MTVDQGFGSRGFPVSVKIGLTEHICDPLINTGSLFPILFIKLIHCTGLGLLLRSDVNLSLSTGCEAVSETNRCTQRWTSLTCNDCDTNGKCQSFNVINCLGPHKCCLTPFNQTAYPSTKITITCEVPDSKCVQSRFLCKEEGNICEDISSKGPRGKFKFTNTSHGFNVSISNVSSDDTGVYWCGLRSKAGAHHIVFRQINLDVQGE